MKKLIDITNCGDKDLLNFADSLKEYILTLLRTTSSENEIRMLSTFLITEGYRQYCTWGVYDKTIICSDDSSVGLEFKCSGLKHKGIVRVYYNEGSDLFDIELLSSNGGLIKEIEGIFFDDLHNILHRYIERSDDRPIY